MFVTASNQQLAQFAIAAVQEQIGWRFDSGAVNVLCKSHFLFGKLLILKLPVTHRPLAVFVQTRHEKNKLTCVSSSAGTALECSSTWCLF